MALAVLRQAQDEGWAKGGDLMLSLSKHQSEPPSTPLVDGTASALRGSISIAWRSARASPLKQLSTMWWLFSPSRFSTCSVRHDAWAKAWNHSLNSSVSISPSRQEKRRVGKA